MAQEQQELRSVNWNEVFAFTHVFKCFRMAIQPSKLLLAAAALVLLFAAGWGLDLLWGGIGGQYVLVPRLIDQTGQTLREPGEIECSADLSPAEFATWRRGRLDGRLNEAAALKQKALANARSTTDFQEAWKRAIQGDKRLAGYPHLMDAYDRKLAALNQDAAQPPGLEAILQEAKKEGYGWSRLTGHARDASSKEVSRIEKLLREAREEAAKDVDKLPAGTDERKKAEAEEALDRHMALARVALTQTRKAFREQVLQVTGMDISSSLATYEWNCIRGAIRAALRGNFVGGLEQYRARMEGRRDVASAATDLGGMQSPPALGAAPGQGGGVLYYLLMAAHGIGWLVRTQTLYAAIYLIVALAITAIFGGAVNRMAALHFAREEKISAGQALRFAFSKFVSFFTAPLIPVGIILILGLVVAGGGFVLLNWWVADWLGGILFFLAILAGLGMAFLATGLVGGAWIMYPTIAAEGSDSFDAISRSYSYVFARPWRAILYGAVACVYGAITYVFVRFFAFVALAATHWFAKVGVTSWLGGGTLSPNADRLDLIWTAPTFDNLWGGVNWDAMGFMDKVPALLIGVWVFFLACVVAGYLLTYAASATTVIYFLLRRKVDATDLDDVYVEEPPEEAPPAPEAAPAPAGAPAAPAAPAGGEAQTPPGGDTATTP